MDVKSFLQGAGESVLSFGASALYGDKQAEKQNNRNVDNYRSRHQWEVQDLLAAGLNPILSATQGAPSVASSAMGMASGQMSNPLSSAQSLVATANEKEELVNKIKAETQVQTILAGKTQAEIDQVVRSAIALEAQADLAFAQSLGQDYANAKESVKTKFAQENGWLLKLEQASRSLGIEMRDIVGIINVIAILNRGRAIFGKQLDSNKYGIFDKGTGEIFSK